MYPGSLSKIIPQNRRYYQTWNYIPATSEIFERHYQAARSFDSYDRLEQLKCPTLILTGDQTYGQPENSKMLAQFIPQSNWKLSPRRHGFLEQYPELVLSLVMDFLG